MNAATTSPTKKYRVSFRVVHPKHSNLSSVFTYYAQADNPWSAIYVAQVDLENECISIWRHYNIDWIKRITVIER